jgi:hypothetical protein
MTVVGGNGGRRSATRVLILLPLMAVVGVLLSACGGSTGATTAATTSTTAKSGTNSFTAYTQCLAKNGVKLPTGGFRPSTGGSTSSTFPQGGFPGGGSPGGGGGGFRNNPAFAKAEKACASLRPKGGGGFFGGGGLTGTSATELRTYLNCLEIHGVKVPSGTGTAALGFLRTLSTKPTAADKTAENACASLRPKFPSGFHRGSPTSTTTTTAA